MRKWIFRRNKVGVSETLVTEFPALEDPRASCNFLRIEDMVNDNAATLSSVQEPVVIDSFIFRSSMLYVPRIDLIFDLKAFGVPNA